MRYPKAGYPNPKVRLRVFDLEKYLESTREAGYPTQQDVDKATNELVFDSPFPENDIIISEVVWTAENELMVKATNRIATIERVARFVFDETVLADERIVVGKVVREVDFEKLDGGWAEPVRLPLFLADPDRFVQLIRFSFYRAQTSSAFPRPFSFTLNPTPQPLRSLLTLPVTSTFFLHHLDSIISPTSHPPIPRNQSS